MWERSERFMLFGTPPDRFDWRGVVWFALLYAGGFVLAGALAPPIHLAALWLGEGAEEGSLRHYLAGKGLDVYVDRVRLLFAVGAMFWLIGYCRLWGRFGFSWDGRGRGQLSRWFAVGVGMFVVMAALQACFLDPGWSRPPELGWLTRAFAGAMATAAVVGYLEEAIFRGMVFRMFYTAMRPWAAVILSALVFAAVHFKGVSVDPEADWRWWTGLDVAWRSFLSVYFTFSFFHFTNLFLAGLALNLLFLRTGGLMACVGLHAGWVVVRQTWASAVSVEEGSRVFWLGGRGVVDGVLPVFLLVALIGWLAYATYRAEVQNTRR